MSYLKPQSPLQKGDDYIYPITTADQVIATDGTHRLNNELDEIREETAVIESSSTSSHAYAVGKFLTYNGILYKVTSAIAVGDTLTPGTNITATNVGDQIKSLNDSLGSLFKIKEYSTSSKTVAGNAEFSVTGSDLRLSTPGGYVPVAMLRFYVNNGNLSIRSVNATATGNSAFINGRNMRGSTIDYNASATILYALSSTV